MAEPTAPSAPGDGIEPAEVQPSWRRSFRDVLSIAVIVVGVVLGAAVLTDLLPDPVRRVILDTPIAIVVLIGGTAGLLWRIARKPRGIGG